MGEISELAGSIAWYVFFSLFLASFISCLILHERLMRKTRREGDSLFSPLPFFRSFEAWEFYAFILLVHVMVGSGMAMTFLKDHGL